MRVLNVDLASIQHSVNNSSQFSKEGRRNDSLNALLDEKK